MDNKNKKTLFLTDIETGLEAVLQQKTNTQLENMLIIQMYGSITFPPFGDIMRSVILAIYQENVEEIYVVSSKDKKSITDNIQSLLKSEYNHINDKLKTVDYLFKNCNPGFITASLSDWLEEREDASESVRKSIEIIRHHPFVPSFVKIRGLVVNEKGEFATPTPPSLDGIRF